MENYLYLGVMLWVIDFFHSKLEKSDEKYSDRINIQLASQRKKNKVFYLILSAIILAVTGWFDYKTGYRISVMPLYLIPVSLATYFLGRIAGVSFSFLAALLWLWADLKIVRQGYLFTIAPFWNALVRMFFFLFVVWAIELKKSLLISRKENNLDSLTGFANTEYFYKLSKKEIERCKRYNYQFSLIVIDCDELKFDSSFLGNRWKKKMLKHISNAIKNNIRGNDIAGRMGGQKFTVFLSETGHDGAVSFIKRIDKLCVKLMPKNKWKGDASIGAVVFQSPSGLVSEVQNRIEDIISSMKKKDTNRLAKYMLNNSENCLDNNSQNTVVGFQLYYSDKFFPLGIILIYGESAETKTASDFFVA